MDKDITATELSAEESSWLSLMISSKHIKLTVLTAIILGTAINLIHQGSLISSPVQLNLTQLFLSYIISYIVFSIVMAKLELKQIESNQLNQCSEQQHQTDKSEQHELMDKSLLIVTTMSETAGNVNKASKQRLLFVSDI